MSEYIISVAAEIAEKLATSVNKPTTTIDDVVNGFEIAFTRVHSLLSLVATPDPIEEGRPAEGKRKRVRRTKAQIAADRLAQEEREMGQVVFAREGYAIEIREVDEPAYLYTKPYVVPSEESLIEVEDD